MSSQTKQLLDKILTLKYNAISHRFFARDQEYYFSQINYFIHMNNEILRRITNWIINDQVK